MKIIDIGICINNNDPKGIGRIRYIPYGQYKSEIERAVDYTDWNEKDPFIAIPFLPAHINVIPQLRQSIKLIKYDTAKDTQNVEYVAGPFSTAHDFGSETFNSQHKNTTYGGVIVESLPDVRNDTGGYIDKKSEGTLPKLSDTAINGNYGSSVLFTENGLVLRGGHLIDKSTKNKKTAQRLKDVPMLSDKIAKITLKKFAETLNLVDEPTTTAKVTVSKIKYIVEYDVNDLASPTELRFYAYKVLNSFGNKFDTDVFTESTETDFSDTNTFKLINTGNTLTTPTFIITTDSLKSVYSEAREFLNTIDENDLSKLDYRFSSEDIHPFYFRPSKELRIRSTTTNAEKDNRASLATNIALRGKTGSFLIFSKTSANAPTITTSTIEKVLKTNEEKGEQSFASITSDILYLLSTSTNKGTNTKSIDFSKLNSYEYTQDDLLNKINPNTYGMVRGEVLIDLLLVVYEFLIGHTHNINDHAIYERDVEAKLERMMLNLATELLNQSTRIN